MINPVISIFESFNARPLSPRKVAETFVPPPDFEKIRKRAHSLLIGPRGSGKTTLLKMLDPYALEVWDHEDAEDICRSIDFTGVFVPTDHAWSKQLEALGSANLPSAIRAKFGIAVFTNHILISWLRALKHRCRPDQDCIKRRFKPIRITQSAEVEFVKSVEKFLHLTMAFPSFEGLILAMVDRNAEIGAAAAAYPDVDIFSRMPHLYSHHVDLLASLLERATLHFGITSETWCILFDEFELAPPYIRETVLSGLRSTNQTILFKISIFPGTQDADFLKYTTSPMAFHDFEEIQLWYPRKQEGFALSHGLFKGLAEEFGLGSITPEGVLGESMLTGNPDLHPNSQSSYNVGSKKRAAIQKLAKWDPSFRHWLKEIKKVDPSEIGQLSEDRRAAVIRKITPLVAIREAYLRERKSGEKRTISTIGRSRKNPALYGGSGAIYAVCEGNPRLFLGIMRQMFYIFKETGKQVSPAAQSSIVEKSVKRLRAILRTVVSVSDSSQSELTAINLLDKIDVIGNYFHGQIVQDKFNGDPHGSFVVDDQAVAPEILSLLMVAINAGAIFLVPTKDASLVFNTLGGRVFRLSYLLAPFYHTPLRLGPEVKLSTILRNSNNRPTPQIDDNQLELF